MRLESTIIEGVETFIGHAPFAGSDGVREVVPGDLASRACARPIRRARCARLRERIRRSPHFARGH
jgi:hypothetical protein